MRTSSRLFFAFAALAGSSWIAASRADAPPSLFGKPLPAENGFTLLQEAFKGYGGSAGGGRTLDGADKLRYQRANVTRNLATLRKIREALALPIQHPPIQDIKAEPITYDGFKRLALLLEQESGVNWSNAKWVDALNSHLDIIALGIGITRDGPLDASLAGLEIEKIGREGLEPIMPKLSGEELKAAAARLAQIEGTRTAFADALREEKARAIAQTKQAFGEMEWLEVVQQTTKPNGTQFTDTEKEVLNNIGESEVMASLEQVMTQVEKDAAAPYKPARANVVRGADPWSRMMTDAVAAPTYRVNYEAARAQNLLIQVAIQLLDIKGQTGKYPATLDLPDDPFADSTKGDAKLKYRLNGDSYVLYSVGPNGKDDGGTPLMLTDKGEIAPTVSGDLVGPVFNQ